MLFIIERVQINMIHEHENYKNIFPILEKNQLFELTNRKYFKKQENKSH